VTLEVADIERVVSGCEAAGLRIVDRTSFDDWAEAFVSPRNATGVLFQLMEYHGGYADQRSAGTGLYIGGQRLGEE
jgi:methylmalonyl-CoA/ethylmalonyl-CoA epimerase